MRTENWTLRHFAWLRSKESFCFDPLPAQVFPGCGSKADLGCEKWIKNRHFHEILYRKNYTRRIRYEK